MSAQDIKFKTVRHYDSPGEPHELTFSCYKGRPFLARERACGYLAQALEGARQKHGFHIWAYVFMPEHVHLLIWPTRESYSISGILRSIKQSVARRALRYLRRHNPGGLRLLATGQKHSPYRFWQDGSGYDKNVTDRDILRKMVKYIHENPVRRGLVDRPEDWQWSSARDWMEQGRGPVTIDKESFPV